MTTGPHDAERRVVSFAARAEYVPALEAKGFLVVACNGVDQQREALHADVCQLVQEAPPKVQARFEESYGISPTDLCMITGDGTGN